MIDKKIVMIKYEQIDEVEGAYGIVEDEDRSRLEKKLENLAWKMNCLCCFWYCCVSNGCEFSCNGLSTEMNMYEPFAMKHILASCWHT